MTKKAVVPGFEGKRRTALESIRRFCLACMGGSAPLVAECASKTCTFHGYRMGVIEEGADRRQGVHGSGAVRVVAIQDGAQSVHQRRAAGKAAPSCPGAVPACWWRSPFPSQDNRNTCALTFGSPVHVGLKKQAEKRRGVITKVFQVNTIGIGGGRPETRMGSRFLG